jgi:hypothetical protein
MTQRLPEFLKRAFELQCRHAINDYSTHFTSPFAIDRRF